MAQVMPAEILEACVVESRMEAFFQILRGVTGRLAPAGRTSRRAEPCPESSPSPERQLSRRGL